MSTGEVVFSSQDFLRPAGGPAVPADADAELGNFDIIVVNRVNERLYGKPTTDLLGKKC